MTDAAALIAAAADILRKAEAGGTRPDDLPVAARPATEAEAYAVQDAVIGSGGIAGWKVAAMPGPTPHSCAPLARTRLFADGADFPRGARLPEIEVEIAIRIATDLPQRHAPYGQDEVRAALGSAHAAYEIIESRYADRKQVARLSTLADAQSSRAFGIGSGTADWQAMDFTALTIALHADTAEIRTATGNASVAQTIDALTWLANHAAARGHGLRAGQFVITGARIGPVLLPVAERITASVAGIGAVSLRPV